MIFVGGGVHGRDNSAQWGHGDSPGNHGLLSDVGLFMDGKWYRKALTLKKFNSDRGSGVGCVSIAWACVLG